MSILKSPLRRLRSPGKRMLGGSPARELGPAQPLASGRLALSPKRLASNNSKFRVVKQRRISSGGGSKLRSSSRLVALRRRQICERWVTGSSAKLSGAEYVQLKDDDADSDDGDLQYAHALPTACASLRRHVPHCGGGRRILCCEHHAQRRLLARRYVGGSNTPTRQLPAQLMDGNDICWGMGTRSPQHPSIPDWRE